MASRTGEFVWRTKKIATGGQIPVLLRDRLPDTAVRAEDEGLGHVTVDELKAALLAFGVTRSGADLADIVRHYRGLREDQLDGPAS